MKKLNFWLLASLFVAAFTVAACGDEDEPLGPDNNNNNPTDSTTTPKDSTVTLPVNAENLKGTWDGFVEHDFAQGYYQRWRINFDGENYTTWHTHQMVGTTYDEEQGLKTVGNKEQGTWKYENGKLVLTPAKQWASYYLTAKSINDPNMYYVYYNYNTETMEADQWYETSEYLIQEGIKRDLEEGDGSESGWYIKRWPVTGLTKTVLSIRINKDVFKLNKQ